MKQKRLRDEVIAKFHLSAQAAQKKPLKFESRGWNDVTEVE
jgi:hypothetical protein